MKDTKDKPAPLAKEALDARLASARDHACDLLAAEYMATMRGQRVQFIVMCIGAAGEPDERGDGSAMFRVGHSCTPPQARYLVEQWLNGLPPADEPDMQELIVVGGERTQ